MKLCKESEDITIKYPIGKGCIVRDFNAIKREGERKAVFIQVNGLNELKEFIDKLDLVDVLELGSKCIWFKLYGNVISKLDRFLLPLCVVEKWKVVRQFLGKRNVSNHTHIWIQANILNWEPKPF